MNTRQALAVHCLITLVLAYSVSPLVGGLWFFLIPILFVATAIYVMTRAYRDDAGMEVTH